MRKKVLEGITVDEFEKLARTVGYTNFENLTDADDEDPTVAFKAGQFMTLGNFLMSGESERYKTIALTALFSDIKSVRKMNDWNAQHRFVKGYIARDSGFFEMEIIVVASTEDQVKFSLELWMATLFSAVKFFSE